MKKRKILFLFGTRPEAIKMAPLISGFIADGSFEIRVCVTAQHREMLDQVLAFFNIPVHHDLNLMKPNQALHELTANVLLKLEPVLDEEKPDLVFVQGDTTTVLASALAAYYKKIQIAHLEAGLRSHNLYSPFPEEANRKLTGHLANFHFAPTPAAAGHLIDEQITQDVHIVGNTVIDALHLGLKKITDAETQLIHQFRQIDFSKKLILVTCHRRESFGNPIIAVCEALKEIVNQNADCQIIYPVHPNPNISEVVNKMLGSMKNIFLLPPLPYHELIWIMNKSYLILTDSGGIQEEAPSLGKPVLVLREVTERTEGVEAGTAILVGTETDQIISRVGHLLNNTDAYQKMANAINPYGDGHSSERIIQIIKNKLS